MSLKIMKGGIYPEGASFAGQNPKKALKLRDYYSLPFLTPYATIEVDNANTFATQIKEYCQSIEFKLREVYDPEFEEKQKEFEKRINSFKSAGIKVTDKVTQKIYNEIYKIAEKGELKSYESYFLFDNQNDIVIDSPDAHGGHLEEIRKIDKNKAYFYKIDISEYKNKY